MANSNAPKPRKSGPLPWVEPFEGCGSCVNGWIEDASGFARRCQCWRVYVDQWVRKLAQGQAVRNQERERE
jgi:hypothetical protein